MSTIRITIKTDNAAFHPCGPHAADFPDEQVMSSEVARILRVMADQFENAGEATNPRDINGNGVGLVETID